MTRGWNSQEIHLKSNGIMTAMEDISRSDEDKEFSPCLKKEERIDFKIIGSQRRITLDVLMACWGMGTWLGVNGLYVQLPLLVERLPEGWALASSMVLAIQLANSGLLIYALLKRLMPRVPDAAYIYGLLSLGTLALALNAGVHELSVPLAGEQRSIPFIALTFFVGLVGCTSSVLFYPYLRHFRDAYLTTYFVGEGLSGFVPSLLALVQGVGDQSECQANSNNTALVQQNCSPRFDSATFMALLAVLSAVSLTAFALLNKLPAFESERAEASPPTPGIEKAALDTEDTEESSLVSVRWVGVLVLMASMSALMNGVLPSIQPFSCMPYGTQTYHLAVTLGAMANPTACMLGVWLKPMPPRLLAVLLTVALVPIGYIVATALRSQATPLLADTAGGTALVVVAWVVAMGSVSYGRMWVYGWARGGGKRGMRATGTVGQVGSALGSLAIYMLIMHTTLFAQAASQPAT